MFGFTWGLTQDQDQKLSQILLNTQLIIKEMNIVATDLTSLQAQVAKNTSVEQSAVTLIQGLAAQIGAAGTDPAALAALQSQLSSSADALAAAITANTPAAPPPPPLAA